MKEILKDKNKLTIGLVIIGVIIIGLIIFLLTRSGNKEPKKTLDESLNELGVAFYEEEYHPGVQNKNDLANFTTNGISIDLISLEVLLPIPNDVKEQLNDKDCDFEKTKIKVYPKQPFGVKDYSLKVELACKK